MRKEKVKEEGEKEKIVLKRIRQNRVDRQKPKFVKTELTAKTKLLIVAESNNEKKSLTLGTAAAEA